MTGPLNEERIDLRLGEFLANRAESAASGLASADEVAARVIAHVVRHEADRRRGRIRLIWFAAAALIVMLVGIVAIGTLRQDNPNLPPGLVLIRSGDLIDTTAGREAVMNSGAAGLGRRGYVYLTWSPDGQRVAAVVDVGASQVVPVIRVLHSDGSPAWQLELEPGAIPDLAWAPDGGLLAVAAYPIDAPKDSTGDLIVPIELSLYGADGTVQRIIDLPSDASHTVVSLRDDVGDSFRSGLTWSPNGRWLALQTCCAVVDETALWLVDPIPTDVQPLDLSADAGPIEAFDWSTDGTHLAISSRRCDTPGCASAIRIVDLSNGAARSLTSPVLQSDEIYGSLVWDPNGDRIAASTTPGQPRTAVDGLVIENGIRIIDVRGRVAGPFVAHGEAVVPSEGWDAATITGEFIAPWTIAWTTDGNHVLYLALTGSPTSGWSLRSVGADGGPSEVLARDVEGFAFPSSH